MKMLALLFPEPLGIKRSVWINCHSVGMPHDGRAEVAARYSSFRWAPLRPCRTLSPDSVLLALLQASGCPGAFSHSCRLTSTRDSWKPYLASLELCNVETFLGFTVSCTEGDRLTPSLCCKLLSRCMLVCLYAPNSSRLPYEKMLYIFRLFGNTPSNRK